MTRVFCLFCLVIAPFAAMAQQTSGNSLEGLPNIISNTANTSGNPPDSIRFLYDQLQRSDRERPQDLRRQIEEVFPETVEDRLAHISVTRVALDHASRALFVPSISDIQQGRKDISGDNLFLQNWQAEDVNGRVFIYDPDKLDRSRIETVSGAVVGEFGRVLGIMSKDGQPVVILESGDEITGKPGS